MLETTAADPACCMVPYPAATPPGVDDAVVPRIRGWRSCLTPPPANGWHPSGMTRGREGLCFVTDALFLSRRFRSSDTETTNLRIIDRQLGSS